MKGVVSEAVRKEFEGELKKRERARKAAKEKGEREEREREKEEEKMKKERERLNEGFSKGYAKMMAEDDIPMHLLYNTSPPVSSPSSSSNGANNTEDFPGFPSLSTSPSLSSSPTSAPAWGSPPGGSSGKGKGGASFAQILRSQNQQTQTWNGAPQGKRSKRKKQKLMSTTSQRQYK